MDRIIARMKKKSPVRAVPVRRLDRRDATKHINYNAASTSPLMTRSLEFPDRTSFRIPGADDGEIEGIYRSLGISGPDDLGISFDAWEACKNRSSSDVIDRINSLDLEASTSDNSIVKNDTVLVKSIGYLVSNDGIKGVRPPELKPPPPKQPPIDVEGSSWDFLNELGPRSESIRRPSSSVDEEEEEGRIIPPADEEACSFTTNEGCGGTSSSSTSNTSPVFSSGGSIITAWQKGSLLGRGSFGSVYEGISGDGDFFAVKEVSLLDQGSQAQECIQQLEGEIALLSQLQHPNIVRYRGTAKDESNLYIFLELVTQGSLLKLYQKYQLGDSIVSLYTRQILDGLKYLHDKHFIHRDIKCANILVDASGAVKLADFGLAKVSKFDDIKSCKGTPVWMAPEVINSKRTGGYGSSADIWSLGCTVLEMLTGQIPYSDLENPMQAVFKIGRGVLPEIPDTLSHDARDFILKCLKVKPEERPTATELLNHPFVRRSLPASSGLGSASPLLPR